MTTIKGRVNPKVQKFWDAYIEKLSPESRPLQANVEAQFAGTKEITDSLIELYALGKKWAGSGLVKDYQTAGDALPKVGNYWILLDSKEDPRFILKTIRVVFNKYKDIPEEIAVAEGEGDLSVVYWKKVHGEFFAPYLEKWGISDIEQSEVITEFFEIVHR